MTDAMPAFGAERNRKIAELSGWVKVRGRMYCNGFDSKPYAQMPDYCGDNGDCFGLLVTLQKMPVVREIALRYIDETVCVKISTDLLNYSDGWTYDACEQSTLPGAAGWRDAITQAAWEALTAAKESK